MILRVTVRNLYSFKEKTEISFLAGKSDSHSEQVSRGVKRDDIPVLKAGIIYGANASGKSNIIKAVSTLKKVALSGVPKRQVEPFKLAASENEQSMVELEIKVEGQYYAYGAEFTKDSIVEEWLYVIKKRSDKKVFERRVANGENELTFGDIVGDDETIQLIKFIGLSTPTTDSFLSEYIKRNGKGLLAINKVYGWMKDQLKIILPGFRYREISIKAEEDKDFALATESLLKYFNTGIVRVKRLKINKENVEMPSDMINELLDEAKPNTRVTVSSSRVPTYFFETDKEGDTTIFKQTTVHRDEDGRDVSFEMKEESDGAIRLLDFIPMLFDLRKNNSVYLIDEIDRSMHPMLTEKLLEYYLKTLNPERDTQLLFSTHESHLLDMDLIRADEVWFVEKDENGASHLYSLAEYKPRENVRKGYLQGRYGAIPFFAPIESLKWQGGYERKKEF